MMEGGKMMIIPSWALLAGLILLTGIVALLVVLLMKYPKPTLITLAVLVVLVPLLGVVGAISVRAVAHQQSNPVLVAPNRFDVQVTQPNHPPGGEIDRTWVTDTAAFFNAHPHRKFLIARHTRAAISESEAIEEARMSAAAMLVPNIGVIPNRGPQEYLVFVDQLTVDRVVERTERPYGDIWSAALLLDVSPERIHPVQVAMQDQRMSRASSTRWTIIASIALFAVMWLLYLALNAITRGYYAWRLRTAVFVFLIGGIVLLTMMAQWS